MNNKKGSCERIKIEIELYKEKLNSAVKNEGISLVDEEVVKLSQQLDELIVEYTKKCMEKTYCRGEVVGNG